MPKMPKIVVSLRSVMLYEQSMFCTIDNQKAGKEFNSEPCFFLLIKLIRRRRTSILGTLVQFRQFRHFLGHFIFTQQDLTTIPYFGT